MAREIFEQYITNLPVEYQEILAGGVAGAILTALGVLIFLFIITIYVYHAFAWMTIAKKLKYKRPWLAWIPFASSAMRLQLGKKIHWAWVFLYLIPVVGWIAIWVLLIISHWNIFEKLKYPGWLSLAPTIDLLSKISGIGTIAYLIIIGFVAWKKK